MPNARRGTYRALYGITSSNAKVASKNICDVNRSALEFVNARSGNFDLFNSYRAGRPTTLDNDVLWMEMKTNQCQTIEKLSNTHNEPRSTIQERLQ